MKNPLQRSEQDDWYFVEGAPIGMPEGNSGEWSAILDAMERREDEAFDRVGVRFDSDFSAQIYSPRNAVGPDDYIYLIEERLEDWIEAARRVLALALT